MREEMAKTTDPFDAVKRKSVTVKNKLSYTNDGGAKPIRVRHVRVADSAAPAERKEMASIRNVYTHARGCSTEEALGGITWIELYIWYHAHRNDGGDSVSRRVAPGSVGEHNLLKQLANFKSCFRKVVEHCVHEDDVDFFAAAKTPNNRLRPLAVRNKMAAIKGKPLVGGDDVALISEAILNIKGVVAKIKLALAHEGKLELKLQSLKLRSTSRHIENLTVEHGDWTTHPSSGSIENFDTMHDEKLRDILCGQCGKSHDISGKKLIVNEQFSNWQCQECRKVTTTGNWACACGHPWYKCARHCWVGGVGSGDSISWWVASATRRIRRKRKPIDGDRPLSKRFREIALDGETLCRSRYVAGEVVYSGTGNIKHALADGSVNDASHAGGILRLIFLLGLVFLSIIFLHRVSTLRFFNIIVFIITKV